MLLACITMLLMTPMSAQSVEDSSFTITLPKTVNVSNATECDYSVGIEGAMDDRTTVYVEPVSSFTLQDTNGLKADIDATVTQECCRFHGEGTSNGTITFDSVSAGEWQGELEFNWYTPQ